MIARFGPDTALLIIDAQVGVEELTHWGGPSGRRNNPDADDHLVALVDAWRTADLDVFFSIHDSLEPDSPLRSDRESGALKPALHIRDGDGVVRKSVNGAFFGTDLEIQLRRRRIDRLVVAGYFTNMCVETTVRSAGNLGFDTYLCHEGCATTNRIGLDGVDHDPEVVHALSIASLHGEFCTALTTEAAIALLDADASDVDRAQGNEIDSPRASIRGH